MCIYMYVHIYIYTYTYIQIYTIMQIYIYNQLQTKPFWPTGPYQCSTDEQEGEAYII